MTTESESRMREVLDRIFDYGIDRSILGAPCMFCGYKGEGYWQMGTHDERCPWRYVGGEFDRDQKLRDVVLSPPARRTSYEFERELLLLRLRSAIADKEWVTACANMETEHRDGWSCDWHAGMREAHNEIESIIATLAGLEKEEEPRVTSVRISLAKHGLIDKISPSEAE